MSRQELRRRMLLADPTARDEDMVYGPDVPDEATDEAITVDADTTPAAAEEGQKE